MFKLAGLTNWSVKLSLMTQLDLLGVATLRMETKSSSDYNSAL